MLNREIIMDKKTIIFCILVLRGLLFCHHSYSQTINIDRLQWIPVDTTYDLNFSDTGKALEWAKHPIPLAIAKNEGEKKMRRRWVKNQMWMTVINSKIISINNDNFYVLIVEGCSGIPCQNFYIFNEIKKSWHLIAMSEGRIMEKIELQSIDDKIIFETKSRKIGEYSTSSRES
jgi:hypothetical protein